MQVIIALRLQSVSFIVHKACAISKTNLIHPRINKYMYMYLLPSVGGQAGVPQELTFQIRGVGTFEWERCVYQNMDGNHIKIDQVILFF